MVITFYGLFDGLGNLFLDACILLARPPVCDLRKTRAAEVRVEQCVRTFVWREENEQVFDPALLERPGNMVHRRLGDIRAQDHRQDVHRNVCRVEADTPMMNAQMASKKERFTVFDEVVFRQTLQACSACKALREYDTDGGSKSVPLFRLPLVDVLQK